MKKIINNSYKNRGIEKAVLAFLTFLILLSCNKDKDFGEQVNDNSLPYSKTIGIYVVNEGNFGSGNSSVSFIDLVNQQTLNHIFFNANQRPLGDVAQSITLYKNKAYIVVNNSAKIEVVDMDDFKSLATIEGFVSPRHLLFINTRKAYVSDLYSNKISIINPDNNSITGQIDVKASTEEMRMVNNRVFAINWTGNRVFVIDCLNDSLVKTLVVTQEPNSMVIDKDSMIWILSSGGYLHQEIPSITKINPFTLLVEQEFEFDNQLLSPSSLSINGSGDTLFYINNGICKTSIYSPNLSVKPFIEKKSYNFYKTAVDPNNHSVYVTEAVDFVQSGYLFSFTKQGEKLDSFKLSIIPSQIVFNQTCCNADQSEN